MIHTSHYVRLELRLEFRLEPVMLFLVGHNKLAVWNLLFIEIASRFVIFSKRLSELACLLGSSEYLSQKNKH